jgi:hypothetical protein
MTAIGSRYLLIGGFDGKSTYGEPWWLVPQGNSSCLQRFQQILYNGDDLEAQTFQSHKINV